MTDPYKDALQRAVRLLSSRSRSLEELREVLVTRHQFDGEIVHRVLQRLKELGYLNDEQYASDLAAAKLRNRPLGRRRLKNELLQRKLPEPLADSAVEKAYQTLEEKGLIDEAIRKRIRLRGRPGTRPQLKSLYDHLLRLGFEPDLIRQRLGALSTIDLDESDGESDAGD